MSEADLIPDYTKSVEEVYMDVVEFHLQCLERGSRFVTTEHVLEFLAYVVRRPKGPEGIDYTVSNLTPWMPDWRTPIFPRLFLDFTEGSVVAKERVYNVSGPRKANVTIKGSILGV